MLSVNRRVCVRASVRPPPACFFLFPATAVRSRPTKNASSETPFFAKYCIGPTFLGSPFPPQRQSLTTCSLKQWPCRWLETMEAPVPLRRNQARSQRKSKPSQQSRRYFGGLSIYDSPCCTLIGTTPRRKICLRGSSPSRAEQ